MSDKKDFSRFANLGFADFQRMAADPTLSRYEKIGFPDSYREGMESAIHDDIMAKLPALRRDGAVVLDIGPGCSDLPRMIMANAVKRRQQLHLVDSAEMLQLLPDVEGVFKTAAFYPDCPDLLQALAEKVDVILAYSVLHYIFVDTNPWRFLDATLALLAPSGHLLLGDVPNVSMRKRFFDSAAGKAHHRQFTGGHEDPVVIHNVIETGLIDDAVVFSILQRARVAGFHAFVLPQPDSLPMHNRREDILIIRP